MRTILLALAALTLAACWPDTRSTMPRDAGLEAPADAGCD